MPDIAKFVHNHKLDMLIIALLPLVMLLNFISSKLPNITETIYSENLFIVIARTLAILFNIFPFSIFEIICITLFCIILSYTLITLLKILKQPSKLIELLSMFIVRSITFVSIIYFLFIFLWGFNYNRLPLSDILGLTIDKASVYELENLCENLLEKTLELREQVNEDSTGVMIFEKNLSDIISNAHEGYAVLAKDYKVFSGKFSKPKKVYFSNIMSIITISGIYSPFTGEANINTYPPDIFLPSTICHEMAHQRGFAREDEANFISYLVCKNHTDPQFQYSGYLEVLRYAMHQLYRYDKNKYNDLKKKYSQGMKNDLHAVYQFWRNYSGTIVAKTSEKMNDTYLKINRQKDGTHSYGRVVDLLIAEYRKNAN